MVYFTKINQVSSPTNTPRGFHVETTWKRSFQRGIHVVCLLGFTYSMLQDIGRVASLCQDIVSDNFKSIHNGGEGDWSQNLCEVL